MVVAVVVVVAVVAGCKLMSSGRWCCGMAGYCSLADDLQARAHHSGHGAGAVRYPKSRGEREHPLPPLDDRHIANGTRGADGPLWRKGLKR